MYPIVVPSATPEHLFTEGSPAGGVPATTVSSDWLNDVQEEILNVLRGAGVTPAANSRAQLLQAIGLLINEKLPTFTPVEQGGGTGMFPNKVHLGWDGSNLIGQVDNSPLGGFVFNSPGDLVITTAGTAPGGTLKMNGAAVSRITYAALFAKIGTLYGAGDGSTTFNVPEGRAEFIRGWDDGRGVDSGRALGSWANYATEDHTHGSAAASGGYNTLDGGGVSAPTSGTATGGMITGVKAAETRPRSVAFLFCIRY